MDDIVAKYKFDESILRPSFRLHVRNRKPFFYWTRIPLGICLIAMPGFGITMFLLSTPVSQWANIVFVLIPLYRGIYMVFFEQVSLKQAKNHQKKLPAYGLEVEWTFKEDSYQTSLTGSVTETSYHLLYGTITSKNGFLLYFNIAYYAWIPRGSLVNQEDYDRLAKLLAEKTKNKVLG